MNYLAVKLEYIVWWYSGGLRRLTLWLGALFGWVANFFSVTRVLKTLFSPWKKLVGARRPGLEGLRDFLIDNLVSRGVGFFMRLIILIAYVLTMIGLAIFSVLAIFFWVAWPALLVYAFIRIFT